MGMDGAPSASPIRYFMQGLKWLAARRSQTRRLTSIPGDAIPSPYLPFTIQLFTTHYSLFTIHPPAFDQRDSGKVGDSISIPIWSNRCRC